MAATAAPSTVTELKRRLVDALAVLTGEGVLDGAGHLSVRIPDTDTFLINPRFPGVLAEVDDICTADLSAKRIDGRWPIPSETLIHSVIYRDRPDVRSVLHCHARYSILLSSLDLELVPFTRESRTFAEGIPVMPEDHGINTPALAERMIRTLGTHHTMFLKGHGIVVTGPTVEGVAITAIQLENACRDQLLVKSFANPKPLPNLDRTRSDERMENPYRAWPFLLYKHNVRPREEIRANLSPLPEGQHY